MEQHTRRGRRYSAEEKPAAVRTMRTLRAELGTSQGTVTRVADQPGYGVESVRAWVRKADIDDGVKAGVTTDEQARIRQLEQENRELKRANEILKRRRLSSGRSPTANTGTSCVHQPQQGRRDRWSPARGRAHLQGSAGGPVHVLRSEREASLGAATAGC